jgi:succinate dehydrogenase / fumarate reductase cytochrome b subunit
MSITAIPREFIWRRLHSLMGLWLVLFLIEHLLVNSQAALLLGENGQGFVNMVNAIHNFPYLQVIEFTLLGIPILIHGIWGVKYLFTSKSNSWKTDGSRPSLNRYGRNHAYTWQRITSWILLFGLIGHVAKFRFLDYPTSINEGATSYYFTKVGIDNGLYTVADRLNVDLYSEGAISKMRSELARCNGEKGLMEAKEALEHHHEDSYDAQKAVIFASAQKFEAREAWLQHLEAYKLSPSEVVAVSSSFGTVSLLNVRETFKHPLYIGLYTIFVLAACFHAFNGFWTFLITWGVILSMASQRSMVKFAIGLMAVIAFLGLAAIWGTYWLNLKT